MPVAAGHLLPPGAMGPPGPGASGVAPAGIPVGLRTDDQQPVAKEDLSYWQREPVQLRLDTTIDPAFGPIASVNARAVYRSPMFDLRPELGAKWGYDPIAVPITRSADVEGSHLVGLLTISNPNDTPYVAVTPFTFFSVEYGAITNPQAAVQIQARQDITTEVFAGGANTNFPSQGTPLSAMLVWEPIKHLRYWGIAIVIDYVDPLPAPAAAISFSASFGG